MPSNRVNCPDCKRYFGKKHRIERVMESEFHFGELRRKRIERVSIDKENHVNFIEQFVNSVCSFSSQYGYSSSICYTADNIIGLPNVFPHYGDFPQAFAMRSYGEWWNKAPSRSIDYMPQNNPGFVGQDYIDIEYFEAVYPIRVSIYETYNPGSVIRIWARGSDRWFLLWNGPPQSVPPRSRIFSPPLQTCYFKTKTLRLEFNHSLLPYFTELDAVMLIGTVELIFPRDRSYKWSLTELLKSINCMYPCNKDIHNLTPEYELAQLDITNLKETLHEHCIMYKSDIIENLHASKLISQLEQLYYCVPPLKEGCNNLQKFLLEEFSKFMEAVPLDESKKPSSSCGSFSVFPDEIILKILKNIDFKSLCNMSRVNKHFNNLTHDPLLYTCVKLSPLWYITDERALKFLAPRCKYLRKLDLSWCIDFSYLDLTNFLSTCGSLLTHLKLSCTCVNDYVMLEISKTCKSLKELDLSSCVNISDKGFSYLENLEFLERLDLYRTSIETYTLCKILRANPRMRHLLIACIEKPVNVDEVSRVLRHFCPDLESVDLWKARTLTSQGIDALAGCKNLREVNFGWCGSVTGYGESFRRLLSSCQRLEKICLPAFRGLTDRDLMALSMCKNLKQLDLLGALSLTADICHAIFFRCPKLEIIDLSYCDNITDCLIHLWRRQYPHVAIKRIKMVSPCYLQLHREHPSHTNLHNRVR